MSLLKTKLIFRIDVLAVYPDISDLIRSGSIGQISKDERYTVRFTVEEVSESYQVFFSGFGWKLFCRQFDSEKGAIMYINKIMKTAMKGKLFYRKCINCTNKVYFPYIQCECGFLQFMSIWQIEN